ncbi:MAG: FimV/HubP family polar landmark protein [Xanthomonadales bacterium]|nr:FimV/HubP family polar landmark protein [Xanthomonadales bacterium]
MSYNMNPARLIWLALLILLSPSVFALGLGNIKVESYLNEPLIARIDLLVRPGEDISGVTAKLASAEDYALIGASRDAISVPLRFTVDTQTDQPFVRVASNLPVSEPVVRLIIELNWASGRLLREYTLFLDPPTVPSVSTPPPVIDQRRQPPAAAQPEPAMESAVEEDSIVEDSYSAAKQAEPPEEESVSQTGGQFTSDSGAEESVSDESVYGPVQSGDTLWRIASNWADSSGASVNQVMLAIQRNNPQAFINNNINLLKRGAILRMPGSGDISAISSAAAREEVQQQELVFAGGVALQPSSQDSPQASSQAIAPAVETPLVDVASEMSSTSQADPRVNESPQLEIVPPSEDSGTDSAYGAKDTAEGSSASTSAVALQEELARKEEALITEQQTNEYLQQRIKELESQVQAVGSADLVVEDEEMAAMESRLRDQRQADDSAGDVEAEAVQAAPAVPQVTTDSSSAGKPWYTRWITWVIVLLVLAAAAFGWLRSRRGGDAPELAVADTNETGVRGIKDEAEEILKVLKPADKPAHSIDEDSDTVSDASSKEESDDDSGRPVTRFSQSRHFDHEEAHVLDEDSADPEVRLDLARAYIAMGDREAARAILGEVIEHGDEAQKAEAQDMLAGL